MPRPPISDGIVLEAMEFTKALQLRKNVGRFNVQRGVAYTAVTGEFGLPWRLQTVQIEPHETENLK